MQLLWARPKENEEDSDSGFLKRETGIAIFILSKFLFPYGQEHGNL